MSNAITTGCKKDNSEVANGTIKDYTGLDGCGMLIILDGGGALEILSLPPNTTLIANKRVKVEYVFEPRASICMVGWTAHIISLQYI